MIKANRVTNTAIKVLEFEEALVVDAVKGMTVPSGKMLQFLPENPGKHLHSKSLSLSTQKPLFMQGFLAHSLISTEQSLPVYPGGQAQMKSLTES